MGSNKDTQTQLQILGPMKDQVQYVDCEQRPQACEQAQIAAVPTWLIRGRKFVGVHLCSFVCFSEHLSHKQFTNH